MKKSNKALIVGIVAAVLVLAGVLALVLTQCTGGAPAATTETAAPTEATAPESYEIYWNLDRALYDGKSEAGMSSRMPEEDAYFHIRFFKDGEVVTLRVSDRRVVNSIDVQDIMGLVFDEDGIVVDVLDVKDMPCEVIASKFYVKSAGGNLIKLNSSPDMLGIEVMLETNDATGIWDMTGMSGDVGCSAEPVPLDRVIAIADTAGNVTHVFLIDRSNYMRTHEGECEHCGKTVTWCEWTKNSSLPTTDGHYQLMTDIQLLAQNNIQEDAKVCLDLNGKTVTGKEGTRMYSMHNLSVELAMMDTSAEKTGKLVAHGSSSSFGLCVWVRYGAFYLYDGILDAKDAVSKASGVTVTVNANAYMYMYGGEIIGGKTLYTYNKDTDKYSAGVGGSMCISGKLVLNDGIIRDGYAASAITARNTDGTPKTYQRGLGGNLYVASTGVVEMNGGIIKNGKADNTGGNIYLDGASEFTMTGGLIQGGRTMGKSRSGGNIIGYSKVTLDLKGGVIEGGKATYRGGNIYCSGNVSVAGTIIRSGILIDWKTAQRLEDQASRNIYLYNGTLKIYASGIDGGVQLGNSDTTGKQTRLKLGSYANINSETLPNLTLTGGGSGIKVEVSKLVDKAKIGVSTALGIFTEPTDEANLDNFISNIPGADIHYVDGRLGLGNVSCLCGSNSKDPADHLGDCKAAGIQTLLWSPIITQKLPTATGNYYLIQDINCTGQTSLAENADVKLDLNGFTITGAEGFRILSVHNPGAKLTVCDSSESKTGVIRSVGNASSRGNVVWTRYGSFDFYGGTLDGSAYNFTNTWSAGKDGIFGTSDDTSTALNGGTVSMESGTAIRMFGGTIIGNNAGAFTQTKTVTDEEGNETEVSFTTTTPNGASLYVPKNASFEMYGGEITGGICEGYGGNAYISGKLLIDGGKITGGVCSKNGGNILIATNGVVELRSGSVEGGWGKNVTGNIHVNTGGTVTMSGGTVTGGKVGSSGSVTSSTADMQFVNGVWNLSGGEVGRVQLTNYNCDGTEGGCQVALSGAPSVASLRLTTLDDKADDGKTPGMPVLTISGPTTAANITVVTNQASADFALGQDYTITDADGKAFTLSGSTVTAFVDKENNSLFFGKLDCLCGKTEHTKGCLDLWNGEARRWTPWTSTSTLPIDGGNYYLTDDVTLTAGTQQLKANANVVLDLNGFTVTGKANNRMYATQNTDSNLTITDKSKAQTGAMIGVGEEFNGVKSCCIWLRYGTFNLLGGTLDGSQAVLHNSLDGSSVAEKNGGVICAEAGRTVNIYGGTIIGAKAEATTIDGKAVYAPMGGAIYIPSGATLNMYDGTVKDGSTDEKGGNLYIAGTMNMYGGTVKGGTAANGGNLYVTGTLNIHDGATIEKGNSTGYGGNIYLAGKLVMDGGKVANGTCAKNGGNILIATNGVMELRSGSVEGGWGKNVTGNIHVNANGTLTMSGGTVTGGKVGSSGSATSSSADMQLVSGKLNYTGGTIGYLQATNSNVGNAGVETLLQLSGQLKIGQIKLSSWDSNTGDDKVPADATIAVTGALSGSTKLIVNQVGVFATGKDYTVTDADAATFTTGAVSPFPSCTVVKDGNNLAVYGMDCLCGKTEHTKGCLDLWNGEAKVWKPWTSTTTLPIDGGNYYLTAPVDLEKNGVQKLNKDANVVLDLNGFTVTGQANNRMYATHNEGSNLTITDKSAAQTGRMVGKCDDYAGLSCCIWIRYGEFNLLGGTLDGSQAVLHNGWESNKLAEKNGGVLSISSSRTANIYGGTIIGATTVAATVSGNDLYAPNGGAVYVPSGATLNMYAGTIKDGNSGRYGGNLYIAGTMNMYGGTVTGGSAGDGGNIYIASSGNLNVHAGATIEKGNSTGYGGNIYLAGNLVMDGGKVANGTCAKNGGNICTSAGSSMTLSGGTIEGGWGKNATGNLHVNGTLTMSGGTVTGGKAGSSGSATTPTADMQIVSGKLNYTGGTIGYLQATNTNVGDAGVETLLQLSGQLKIGQIKLTSWDSNTGDDKVPADATIAVTGALTGSTKLIVNQVGVFAAGKDYTVTDADAATFTTGAVSPFQGSVVVREGNTLVIYGMDCLCGKTEHTKGCLDVWNGEAKVWTPWTSTSALPINSGNYYLTDDVTLAAGVQKLNANANVVLDLNGFTVTGKNNDRMYATHNTGSNLTITDKSAAQTGKMVGKCDNYAGKSCCIWVANGTFNLLGGTLDGSQAVLHNGWSGTSVSEKNGGVICAEGGRTVNIYGGTIIGAKAEATTVDGNAVYAPMGGAIYIPSGATLNMYDGTVKGGSTEKNGGNIYIKGGTMNLYGGTIEGGNAKECGGNIFINGGTMNMTGGVIKNGTRDGSANNMSANFGFINGGVLNISGGEIYGRLNLGTKLLSSDTTTGTVNVSGSAKIYTPTASPSVSNNNLSATLTVNIGKLNDDAQLGLQLSASANPINSSDKANPIILASFSDAASLQKALDEGRIGISVYIASDTYKRTYALVAANGKLGVYQVSATK